MQNPFGKNTKLCIHLTISLSVAVLVYFWVHTTLQFTAQRIELLGFFPSQTKISVSNILQSGETVALNSFEIEGSKDLQRVGTGYINKHIDRLKIEFHHSGDGLITLSRIKVFFPYLEQYYFTQNNISKLFTSPQSNAIRSRQYQGKHIIITSDQPLARPNNSTPILLAILFFAGSWLLIRHSNISQLAAFTDMQLGNKISSSAEFNTINGLRGLAALLVLFSHTAPHFEAVQLGLSLLFVISGFLLSKPFVTDPKKIFSFGNVERYLIKRIKRILPMYYLYVFMLFGATGELETFARHILFMQGDGHLWPMTQIFAFYMLLPLLLVVTSAAHYIHRLLPLIIISLLSVASYHYLSDWKPFYNGRFSKEFFLYAFLLGVLSSYLYYDLLQHLKPALERRRKLLHCLGLVSLLVTVMSILWSAPVKPTIEIWFWISQFWVKCVLSALIIMLALFSDRSFSRALIGNGLFRSVGVIGFSFYLLHGLGMELFTETQRLILGSTNAGERGWSFTLGAFLFTYPMALFSYSFIERPFFGYRKGRSA